MPEIGKDYHWVTDINSEIPIKITPFGPGSERPMTVSSLFINQVKSGGTRNSMLIVRGGKKLIWTWDQYFSETMSFAKSLAKMKV